MKTSPRREAPKTKADFVRELNKLTPNPEGIKSAVALLDEMEGGRASAPKLNFLKPSKIKRFMKEHGMRVSRTYMAVLDHEVQALMEKHARMAKSDRRKTVMAIDVSLSQTIKSLARDLKR